MKFKIVFKFVITVINIIEHINLAKHSIYVAMNICVEIIVYITLQNDKNNCLVLFIFTDRKNG